MKKSRPNLFYRYVFTYMLTAVLSAVCVLFSYMLIHNLMSGELQRSNELTLNQLQYSYDKCISDIEDFVTVCASNKTIAKFSTLNGELTPQMIYESTNISNTLSDLKNASKSNGEYAMYFSSTDTVITTRSATSSVSHYNVNDFNMSYEEYLNLINTDTRNSFLKIPLKNGGFKYLYTARTFFTRSFGNSNATFIAILDNDDFEVISENLFDDANFFIQFAQDNIMGISSSIDISASDISNASDSTIKINGKGYIISSVPSKIWNINYIMLRPLHIVNQKLRYVSMLYIALMAIILLGGIIMALYFAKRNYLDVSRIKRLVEKHISETPDSKVKNEFELISSAINNLISKNNSLYVDNHNQEKSLKKNSILNLFNANSNNSDNISAELLRMGVTFVSDKFAVILVKTEEYNDYDSYSFIVSNMLEALCSQNNKAYVVEKNGFWVCLINFDIYITADDVENEITTFINLAYNIMKQEFNVNLIFSASRLLTGFQSLYDGYMEALSVMDYKMTYNQNDVIFLDDIYKNTAGKKLTYFTFEEERELLEALIAGNAAEAVDILETLFNNIKVNSLIVFGAKCFAYDIFCTMIRAAITLSSSTKKYLDKMNIPNQLARTENNDEILEIMINAVVMLCDYIENNISSISILENKVMDYIYDNFSDFDMGLQKIADHLNMHPVYLSSSFKERCGEGISKRIEKVRLTKALEFLNSGFSISDTALKVGYANIRTFSTAFKRYYGINPSSVKGNKK